MEFRILGPLEAWNEGREVPIGGRKPRALLAVLLVHPNEVVPTDRLIDELWGEDSPEDAAAALRVNVSRLRKALPPGVLTTRSPGYVIRIEPDALDLHRFERLVEEGRSLLARGLAADASERLRTALALWRGPALADFTYESFAQGAIARLEEIRLAAVELRIDADLALGRHEELVGELEAFVAEHPLRERPRRSLMIALYRSDRQAEALDAYQDARRTLVDELGLDPSAALQELEQAILRQEPALDVAPLDAISNTNLPRPASSFVGREHELAELLSRIHGGARLLTLSGPGGSGKTRLALEAAASLVPSFEAGVFWVELAPLRDTALVLEAIRQSLDAKGDLAEYIGVRKMLVLVDNLEHLIDAAPELSRLVSECPNLTLLVTSRELLRVSGEVEYPVPPLGTPEAVSLFCERSQLEATDEIVVLCARLDNLPLAVELAAARTKALSPSQILERISQRLDLFQGGRDVDPRQQTIRATIEWSYDLLTEKEKNLLTRLSVFAGSCTLPAAHEVCGGDVASVASLVDKSLVLRDGDRFYLLETIREYAREKLEADGALDATTRALADYLLGVERSVGVPLTLARTEALRGLMWQELDNLRVAIDWALAAQENELALRLALAARFAPAWLPPEMERWLDEALRDRRSIPPRLLAEALRVAALVAGILGDQEKSRARIEESVRLYREHGDERDLIGVLNSLSASAAAEGDYDRARALNEESLELATRHADDAGAIRATHDLGDLELQLGNLDAATLLLQRSADLARAAGATALLTGSLHGLGDVALASRDPSRAAGFYIEALQSWWRVQAPVGTLHCVAGLAAVAALEGDVERTGRLWGSVAIFEREGGTPLFARVRTRYEEVVNRCAEASPAAFATAVERGRQMSRDETVDYATGAGE